MSIYFKHIFSRIFVFATVSFLTVGIITGCNGGGADKPAGSAASADTTLQKNEAPATQTAVDLAGLRGADSVQILFFTDPYGKDSLRYTRFFKHYNTSDTAIVNPLLKNLDKLFVMRNEVMNCRSEGKLFFFKGEQELKTVYFNTGANAKADASNNENCTFLYFIKDGGFYYLSIDTATIALLKSLKPKAVEPAATMN